MQMAMECDHMSWTIPRAGDDAGDDASMPIQMWQHPGGLHPGIPPKSHHTTAPVNRPSCFGPCPTQVKLLRTKTCDHIEFNL